jgi:hypothetical protein
MINYRIDGLDDLERGLRVVMDTLSDGTRRAVVRAVEAGEQVAKHEHKYKNRTGELQESTEGRVTASAPGGATGELRADADHASYVEGDTRAHIIRPRSGRGAMGPLVAGQKRGRAATGKRFLRFKGPGGEWVFARSVNHPGTKGQPFMGPAYEKMERVLVAEIEVAMDKAAREFNEK